MDDETHERLHARAERLEVSASQLVNRYVKEGLIMDEHPGIKFVTTPEGRRAVLASRPRLLVIDLLGTWKAEHQNVPETARYFDVSEDDVRAVVRYYAAHRDELDDEIRRHLEAQQNFKRALEHRETRSRRRIANA